MKITWLGHSCFLLTGDRGSILTDPFHEYVGYKMPSVAAKTVTVSHHHPDHDYLKGVSGVEQVLDKAGNYSVNGYPVSAIPCFHDKTRGQERGENLVFNFIIDGVKLCHLGDLGEITKPVLEAAAVDVLFIPVGGTFTIDAAEAASFVRSAKPAYVVPMHYLTPDCDFNISPLEDFLRCFNKVEVVYADGNTFELSSVDTEGTKVVVLKK